MKLSHSQSVMELTASSSWEHIQQEAPFFPRGWFELSRLTTEDRKEFLQLFWQSKLSGNFVNQSCLIANFFASVEDILIFLVRQGKLMPKPLLIYATSKGNFFGSPPAFKDEIKNREDEYPDDYLNFLSIHNGFAKEETGKLFSLSEGVIFSHHFQKRVADFEGMIDPKLFSPFFQREKKQIQCFFSHKKRGCNLLFDEKQGSDFCPNGSMIFPTFLAWLSEFLLK